MKEWDSEFIDKLEKNHHDDVFMLDLLNKIFNGDIELNEERAKALTKYITSLYFTRLLGKSRDFHLVDCLEDIFSKSDSTLGFGYWPTGIAYVAITENNMDMYNYLNNKYTLDYEALYNNAIKIGNVNLIERMLLTELDKRVVSDIIISLLNKANFDCSGLIEKVMDERRDLNFDFDFKLNLVNKVIIYEAIHEFIPKKHHNDFLTIAFLTNNPGMIEKFWNEDYLKDTYGKISKNYIDSLNALSMTKFQELKANVLSKDIEKEINDLGLNNPTKIKKLM